MRDADKMTPAELRKLADEKDRKPRIGKLKQNLYVRDEGKEDILDHWIFSKPEIGEAFKIIARKGEIFESFFDDGKEYWRFADITVLNFEAEKYLSIQNKRSKK